MIAAILGVVIGLAALSVVMDIGDHKDSENDDVEDDKEMSPNFLEAPDSGGSSAATENDDAFEVDSSKVREDGLAETPGVIYNFDPDNDLIAVRGSLQPDSRDISLGSIRVEGRSDSDSSLVRFNFSTNQDSPDTEYVVELDGISELDEANFGLILDPPKNPLEASLSPASLLIGDEALEQYGVEVVYDYTDIGSDTLDKITCAVDTDSISTNEHEVYEYSGFDEEDSILITLPPGFSGAIIQVPPREVAVSDDNTAIFSEQYVVVRPEYLEAVSSAILTGDFDVESGASLQGVYAVIIINSGPIPEVSIPVRDEYGNIVGENTYNPYWNYWPKVDITEAIDRVLV